jgi:glycosyltransferase involved in cell wall biosynthesis
MTQTYANFEVIVIDDGSTDGTDNLIDSYTDDRLTNIRQNNHGVAHARNRGIEKSTGDFIAFLDSDDWWTIDKLQKTADYIHNSPQIKIFHSEEVWYRKGILLPQKLKHKNPTGSAYESVLRICCISMSTAVLHKEVFSNIGTFDESFEACEDYDLWLRATNKYTVKLIPEALTLKEGGRADQLSSNVWGLDRFRIKALEKMLESNELTPKHYEATYAELRKKCFIFAKGAEKHGKAEEATYYRKLCKDLRPSTH